MGVGYEGRGDSRSVIVVVVVDIIADCTSSLGLVGSRFFNNSEAAAFQFTFQVAAIHLTDPTSQVAFDGGATPSPRPYPRL